MLKEMESFFGCTELSKVAEIMVKTTMNTSYPLVYRLVELTLILPVATASVERVFSAMALLKTDLRSKIGDEWLNDLMICYVEKEIFRSISSDKIIHRFEDMKKRRRLVPKDNLVVCLNLFEFHNFLTLLFARSLIYFVLCRLLLMGKKNNGCHCQHVSLCFGFMFFNGQNFIFVFCYFS